MGQFALSRSKYLPVLWGDFCLRIIPLAPHGGDFRCRRHHTYDTQSLLYRVTGTSEADFTSWPRTRKLNNIGNISEMLSWCLAFQTLFRVVAPPGGLDRSVDITDISLTLRPDYLVSSPFTHGPLESWATGLISYSWIHTSYPLLTRDGYILLSRLYPSSAFIIHHAKTHNQYLLY